MPGSSLWLCPPRGHPLDPRLSPLIERTALHFTSPHFFLPHVTLTSEVPPSSHSSDPQKWLDSLPLPAGNHVVVKLGQLKSDDVFFRKLYSSVDRDGLSELGKQARKTVEGYGRDAEAQKWVEEKYTPHLSLLYHDCPQIDDVGLAEVAKYAQEAGINLQGEGDYGGWTGGRVVLVPTDRPIREWTPLAERQL